MRTKKAVGAMVSLAAGLLSLASQVHAGPVTQLSLGVDGEFANYAIRTQGGEAFSDAFRTLTLSSNRLVSGNLLTQSTMAVDVVDVYLVKLDAQGQADMSTGRSFTEQLAVDWSQADYGAEQWSLAPVLLSAGTWELRVSGDVLGGKHGAAYSGRLQTGNSVPEPQTLALSLVALAAMAGLKRRRQKA